MLKDKIKQMQSMIRYIYTLTAVFLFGLGAYAQSGELQGKVTDSKGEGVAFATVVVEQNGAIKAGAQTDFDGYYSIKPIPPGKYDVRVTYVGYQPSLTTGVVIGADKTQFLDVKVSNEQGINLDEVVIKEYKVPLISKDNTVSGNTLTREEIANLPTRNVESIASTSAGVVQADEGSGLNVRGSRDDATLIFVDGVRVRGNVQLPPSSIEQMDVFTGGLPAKYGDATGGVINITTRGASKTFNGGIEALTSYGLDPFGYLTINGNLSGPILKKKDSGQPILGFFIAGEYLSENDSDPSFGFYRLKQSSLDKIKANPLVIQNAGTATQTFVSSSRYLTSDDFESIKRKENFKRTEIKTTGKLDLNVTDNMGFTLGGTFNTVRSRGYNRNGTFLYNYALLNYENNPDLTQNTYRGFVRFTHRIGANKKEGEVKSSLISNPFYTIQFDYTKYSFGEENPNFGDDVFKYGHYGKFTTTRQMTWVNGSANGVNYKQQQYASVDVDYTPADYNTALVNVNNFYFGNGGYDDNILFISGRGGFVNGTNRPILFNLWEDYGRVPSVYAKNDRTQMSVNLNGSFDIKPKRSGDKGKHAIELGFFFDRRADRSYTLAPNGLWNFMRTNSNYLTHRSIDTVFTAGGDIDSIFIDNNATYVPSAGASQFHERLRDKLGIAYNQYVDVDALDVDQLSLDLFTPDEMGKNGFIGSNYGYDHTGKKISGNPSFNDFWTAKDAAGNFTRPVGAFTPIYMGGYIQDKFTFKDIIFNVGLRVDRFDANQKVLRDKYSFYKTKTVAEVNQLSNGVAVAHPSVVPSDATVYTNATGTTITGYRSGDQWYDATGKELNDGELIRVASGNSINPIFADGATPVTFQSSGFNPDNSFTDYKPQINVMPRIAFSFPISDNALFFAHYDVLTQRPLTGARMSAFDWFYNTQASTYSNPDLKPTRTIDYELGFRQKIGNNSAFEITSFYRELRDQIQRIKVNNAYPYTYNSYGNVDFGTVKGFSFEYDLRRTKNITLKANYTLQFADGTGSDEGSQADLLDNQEFAGLSNIKIVSPLGFDVRNTITATIDYRFGEGADYNGPILGKFKVLENFGVNLLYRAYSGRPYSRSAFPTSGTLSDGNPIIAGQQDIGRAGLTGGINSSRLPWNSRLDLQVDKSFKLTKGKSPLYLEVFLQVQNILNTRNILHVYNFTGLPDDDGYLATAQGQQYVSNLYSNNAETVSYLYGLKMANPAHWAQPRVIRIGARFNF